MDFSKLIDRVKNILVTPKTEWPVVAAEPETVQSLYINYICILAAIPAVFGFLKASFIGYSLFGVTYRVGVVTGVVQMILAYAVSLGVCYLMGLLVDALAPTFGGQKSMTQGLKTAAYSYTPGWLVGVFAILPSALAGLLALAAAIYGIYLMYLGLPHTMKCPQDRAGGYAAVVIIVGFVASFVLMMVVGMIIGAGAVGGAAITTG